MMYAKSSLQNYFRNSTEKVYQELVSPQGVEIFEYFILLLFGKKDFCQHHFIIKL